MDKADTRDDLDSAAKTEISLADRIDAVLPQTQCQQCQHAGCRPYAEALARGEDSIDRCPPGGRQTLRQLSALTQQAITPQMLIDHPEERPERHGVWIDPEACIGCTKCIHVCPTDAILGSAKHLHQIMLQDCTGCDLCIPACPVDCIEITKLPTITTTVQDQRDRLARSHVEQRKARLARQQAKQRQAHQHHKLNDGRKSDGHADRLAAIQAALARKKAH